MLTLTRVRPDDPAFSDPTKFVGPFYEADEARVLESERGYVMKPDPHGGWRRVVPSPKPYSIVETPIVRQLVADGVVVIAGGGGGVPVIEDGPRLIGKEGVVDKDLASAILATEVDASTLLILTDVKKVQRGYGSFMPEDIDRMTVREAIALLKKGEFGEGSMGPKVEAATSFARSGGPSGDRGAVRCSRGVGRRGRHADREGDRRSYGPSPGRRPGFRNWLTIRKSAKTPTTTTNSTSRPTKNFSRKPGASGQNAASNEEAASTIPTSYRTASTAGSAPGPPRCRR